MPPRLKILQYDAHCGVRKFCWSLLLQNEQTGEILLWVNTYIAYIKSLIYKFVQLYLKILNIWKKIKIGIIMMCIICWLKSSVRMIFFLLLNVVVFSVSDLVSWRWIGAQRTCRRCCWPAHNTTSAATTSASGPRSEVVLLRRTFPSHNTHPTLWCCGGVSERMHSGGKPKKMAENVGFKKPSGSPNQFVRTQS